MQNELPLQPYDFRQLHLQLYPRMLHLGHKYAPPKPVQPELCRLVLNLNEATATLDIALVPTDAQK